MFGISFAEVLVILAVLLIVLGPHKLPEAASWLGKLGYEVRRATEALRREWQHSLNPPSRPDSQAPLNTPGRFETAVSSSPAQNSAVNKSPANTCKNKS